MVGRTSVSGWISVAGWPMRHVVGWPGVIRRARRHIVGRTRRHTGWWPSMVWSSCVIRRSGVRWRARRYTFRPADQAKFLHDLSPAHAVVFTEHNHQIIRLDLGEICYSSGYRMRLMHRVVFPSGAALVTVGVIPVIPIVDGFFGEILGVITLRCVQQTCQLCIMY